MPVPSCLRRRNTRKSLGLCPAAHWRPLMKYGLVHASLSSVLGATTETEAVPCGRITRSGVHEVAVHLPLGPEKFLIAAGGGHRLVLQEHLLRGLPLDRGDRGSGRASRAVPSGGAPSAVDAAADPPKPAPTWIPVLLQTSTMRSTAYPLPIPPGSISTPGRSNRTVRAAGSSMDVPVAHFLHRRLDFRPMRQPAAALVESPNLHQRAHGNVEGPFALPAVFQAGGKQIEQLRGDRHRPLGGVTVDFAPLAVLLVVR